MEKSGEYHHVYVNYQNRLIYQSSGSSANNSLYNSPIEWSPQVRTGKGGTRNRLCIWLELADEPDYMVILDVRDDYKLLWTAFVPQYPHEKRKKQKEYEAWIKTQKSSGDT